MGEPAKSTGGFAARRAAGERGCGSPHPRRKLRLGTRVTVHTTLLVAAVLALSSYAALYVRRSDLEEDLKRQAHEVAEALTAGLEPLDRATAEHVLKDRVWLAKQRDHSFQIEILKAGDRKVGDRFLLTLLQGAEIDDAPFGQFVPDEPFFVMAVPLHDKAGLELPLRDPRRKPIAVVALRRDTRHIDAEVRATARRTAPLLVGVIAFLALLVHYALRTSAIQPLRRLLDGIEAVGKGDLSRVLLAERDDEIGTLAGRFNAMTASLREAREETRKGTEARLALETRLRQAEKLATIGQMAAEIAHEVGTPLNVISGRARAMARKSAAPDEVEKNAGIVAAQVDRIARIIKQVLDFSRKSGPTRTKVDLGAVVSEALDFLRETLERQHIRREVTLVPGLPAVPGDPDQIQQVCLNLVMNAVHAMPSGGTLSVSTARVTRRKEGLDLTAPAEYAMLQVGDTGAGVPPTDREKIFEPFFTTKDAGHGTGLGLSVSHGIVKDHDGWIEVDGRPEGGALFRVYLPITAAAGPGDTHPTLPRAA